MQKPHLITLLILLLCLGLRFVQVQAQNRQKQGRKEVVGYVSSVTQPVRGVSYLTVGGEQIEMRAWDRHSPEIGDLIIVVGTYKERVITRFYAEKYLRSQDIKILQKYDEKSVKKKGFQYPFLEVIICLHQLKTYAVSAYQHNLSAGSSGLLSGMVLGAGEQIPFELYTSMKESGLAHLVVASGSNIALVGASVLYVLSMIPRRKRYLLAGMVIWAYAVLSGLEPPVVRAAVMVSLVWAATITGRKTSGLWVLLLCCLGMLVVQPGTAFSLSFQLSVAATTGLVLFTDRFSVLSHKTQRKLPILGWVIGLVSQTLAAQIMILPLLMHYFGSTNLISIISNVLVAWLVTPVVVIGMGMVALYRIAPVLCQWCAIPLELGLRYIQWVGAVTARAALTKLTLPLGWMGIGLWWGCVLAFWQHTKKAYLAQKAFEREVEKA